jgi:hypothetical protein
MIQNTSICLLRDSIIRKVFEFCSVDEFRFGIVF